MLGRIVAAATIGGAVALAAPAVAETACVTARVVGNGDAVVDEAHCV